MSSYPNTQARYAHAPQPAYPPQGHAYADSVSTNPFNSTQSFTRYDSPPIQMSDRMRAGMNRTPSPTPSEAEVLNMKGFTNRKKYFKAEYWKNPKHLAAGVAIVVILVLFILMMIFHDDIVKWLKPFTDFLHNTTLGWLIPVGILFVLSFPPLFGHEIISGICGLVYGIWKGWAIVVLGTFLGELANFLLFKYACRARAEKVQKKSIYYGCLSQVVRDGGVFIPLMARYSLIPPHFLTMLFATCGMKLWVFVISALGGMPRQLIPVYLGTLLDEDDENESPTDKKKQKLIMIGLIVVTIVVTRFAMRTINGRMEAIKVPFIYQRRKERQKAGNISLSGDAGYSRVPLTQQPSDLNHYKSSGHVV